MATLSVHATPRRRSPFRSLWFQVIVAILAGIAVGRIAPATGAALKPLGDGFIRLITMVITAIIFCTIVNGIAGMKDAKQVGKVGGKALLYFEVVSSLALLTGLIVGNLVHPGSGFNVNPATLNAKSVLMYATQARATGVASFVEGIIPRTLLSGFATGSILQVVMVAILTGFAVGSVGKHGEPLLRVINSATGVVFKIVDFVMVLAPIGAFGAMAFTVGRYGVASLEPLLRLILTFIGTCILFVVVVLGSIAAFYRFSIFKFLRYIGNEIVLVLGTSSSEVAMPSLMQKLENLGCSQATVGLVVPIGYTFNTDGSSLYITLAALFVAQATNTHLTLMQQLSLFGVAVLTSMGSSGVQGAGFIALAGTLMVVPDIPVAGMALLLGIDRFLSTFRALINLIGNGVASIVIACSEKEVDADMLRQAFMEAQQ
ncbi:MAG: C4-dicarboxylate transporter DctA [Acidobacteriota bacterium]